MPTVRRTEPSDNPEHIARLAQEYMEAKEFAERASARADALKKQLSEHVDRSGEQDEKGNLWVTAAPGLELKRERRSSRTLKTVDVEKWAKHRGVWDSVCEVVEQVSEDNLMTLAWERPELAPEIADLYGEKVTWAFRIVHKEMGDEGSDAV